MSLLLSLFAKNLIYTKQGAKGTAGGCEESMWSTILYIEAGYKRILINAQVPLCRDNADQGARVYLGGSILVPDSRRAASPILAKSKGGDNRGH